MTTTAAKATAMVAARIAETPPDWNCSSSLALSNLTLAKSATVTAAAAETTAMVTIATETSSNSIFWGGRRSYTLAKSATMAATTADITVMMAIATETSSNRSFWGGS